MILQRKLHLFKTRTIGWENLKKLQNIKVINSMYIWILIVPVLAKAMRLIEGIVDVTIFDYTFSIDLGLPFSWYLFYFSAIFFVLGNLMVIIFCPSIIKDQLTMRVMEEKGKSEKILEDYALELNKRLTDFGTVRLAGLYEAGNRHGLLSRVITSFFYAVGLSLISFVMYENLIVVLSYMAE